MQFLEHVGEVILDCLVAELQRGRNFLVGQTFRHQSQHALFLRRKGLSPHRAGLSRPDFDPIQRPMGEGRIENRLTVGNGTNRSDQQAGVDILEDVSLCAGQHGRQGGIIIGIGCEKDDSCRGVTGENLTSGVDAGAIREPNVHQDDVRLEAIDRLHRSYFGSCFTDNGNAVMVVQDGSQANTDHLVIVDQEQAYRFGFSSGQ